MKEATARLLVDLVEDIGEEAELREDYSGRGMYGKTTHGIVVSSEQTLVRALANFVGSDIDDDQQEALDDLAGGYRTDNMGYDIIIY